VIWVAGLVRQSAATVAIFEPGSDCGMPYAPEDGFIARWFHPDSRCHSASRHCHWEPVQPRCAARLAPISRLEPVSTGPELGALELLDVVRGAAGAGTRVPTETTSSTRSVRTALTTISRETSSPSTMVTR